MGRWVFRYPVKVWCGVRFQSVFFVLLVGRSRMDGKETCDVATFCFFTTWVERDDDPSIHPSWN